MISVLRTAVTAAGEPAWRPLFKGRNLDGWETYLAKPQQSVHYAGEKRDAKVGHAGALGVRYDPTKVFSVVNGRVVMRLTEAALLEGGERQPARAGRVQRQSEGAEHFICRIEWRPIREVPAALR